MSDKLTFLQFDRDPQAPGTFPTLRILLLLASLLILVVGCQRNSTTPAPVPTPQNDAVEQSSGQSEDATASVDSVDKATPASDGADVSGTLELWHSWSGSDAEALEHVLQQFYEVYPNVTVETLFVAYDQLPQAYADAVVAGGGPDLVLATSRWLPELVSVEAVLPLDSLVSEDQLSRYLPATVQSFRHQSRIYGLPTHFELVGLYYNRSLVSSDQLPGTTAEMLSMAQHEPEHGAGLYANLYHLYWGIPAYGATLFDETDRVVLHESPGTAQYLAWLKDMGQTPGTYVDQDYGMLLERFKKGEFAFFVDGPWNLAELRNSLGDDLALAQLPAGPVESASPWLSADGVFLNPVVDEGQQELALMLAFHLTNDESSTTLTEVGERLPANLGATVNDPILVGFIQQATTALPEPRRTEMSEVWAYTGDMILKVLNEVSAPGVAVNEAAALINEAIDR